MTIVTITVSSFTDAQIDTDGSANLNAEFKLLKIR